MAMIGLGVRQVIVSSIVVGFSLISMSSNAIAQKRYPWGTLNIGCRNEDRGIGTFNVNVTDREFKTTTGGILAESRFFPESQKKVHTALFSKRLSVPDTRSVGRVRQESFRVNGSASYAIDDMRNPGIVRYTFDGTAVCLPSPRPPIG